jgi:DNA-binding transcriptional MerR regulator
MDWSIQDVARLAGTTSRTLRHYDEVGLLAPTRVGANGYRYYDQAALVRLQRILLLRQWGMGLADIGRALDADPDKDADVTALREHLTRLAAERDRLDRQLVSVQRTITRLEAGEPIMADQMFDGFDHEQYKDEVTTRWGEDAYAASNDWWQGLDLEQRQEFQDESQSLAAAWRDAFEAELDPGCDEVQELARRHHQWVRAGWGGRPVSGQALTGLAQMYVADERFAQHYGGVEVASYLGEAVTSYAERQL